MNSKISIFVESNPHFNIFQPTWLTNWDPTKKGPGTTGTPHDLVRSQVRRAHLEKTRAPYPRRVENASVAPWVCDVCVIEPLISGKSLDTSSGWWFPTWFFFHFIYGRIHLLIDEVHHFSRWLLHHQAVIHGLSHKLGPFFWDFLGIFNGIINHTMMV